MEELTKYQFILLTLLISFVTSLATGIVTVSLMDQSPQGVTQNINRVVERTIERVVEGPEKIRTVEVPVVVSEEDLIVKVVNAALPSIAKVVRKQGDKTETVSIAFAIAPNWFATAAIPAAEAGESYQLKLENGKTTPLEKIERKDGGIAFLKHGGDSVAALPLAAKDGQIGQTVVAIGSINDERQAIAVGIITSISGQATSTAGSFLRTNAATTDNAGGPLLNIKGELVGISSKTGAALSSVRLKTLFDSIK